jgi:hypothetical protein
MHNPVTRAGASRPNLCRTQSLGVRSRGLTCPPPPTHPLTYHATRLLSKLTLGRVRGSIAVSNPLAPAPAPKPTGASASTVRSALGDRCADYVYAAPGHLMCIIFAAMDAKQLVHAAPGHLPCTSSGDLQYCAHSSGTGLPTLNHHNDRSMMIGPRNPTARLTLIVGWFSFSPQPAPQTSPVKPSLHAGAVAGAVAGEASSPAEPGGGWLMRKFSSLPDLVRGV